MSMPTQSNRRAAPAVREDCRDYLRTGRCKYGASCKYFHPPNVQSGGGMKGPVDPNEPMYPIRPNEPPCTYYMKHGTCKFGQSCIFHHPPEISNAVGQNGSTASLPLGAGSGGPKPATSYIAVGAGGPGVSRRGNGSTSQHSTWASDSGIQILPQRPGEHNCSYFLKNGRCRYGATCRFHHPIHVISDGAGSINGGNSNSSFGSNSSPGIVRGAQPIHAQSVHPITGDGLPKVQYITSLPSNLQQGHFVVSGGSLSFVSLDGNPSQSQAIVIPNQGPGSNLGMGNDQLGIGQQQQQQLHRIQHQQQHYQQRQPYHQATQNPQTPGSAVGKSLGLSREVASSTSSTSIASSYDTLGSNGEAYVAYGDSGGTVWTSRMSGSGTAVMPAGSTHTGGIHSNNSVGNLSSFTTDSNGQPRSTGTPVGQRSVLVHASSDGAFTTVSQSDSVASFYDSTSPPPITRVTGPVVGVSQMPPTPSSSAPSWGRGRRSASFDHIKSRDSNQIQKSSSVPEFPDKQGTPDHRRSPADRQFSGPRHGRRPSQQHQRQQQQQNRQHHKDEDEGFSRMASALLTIIDTKEDATREDEGDENNNNDSNSASQASTPRMRPQFPSKTDSTDEDGPVSFGDRSRLGHQDDESYASQDQSSQQYIIGSYPNMPNNGLESIGGQYIDQRHPNLRHYDHQQYPSSGRAHLSLTQKHQPHQQFREFRNYPSAHNDYRQQGMYQQDTPYTATSQMPPDHQGRPPMPTQQPPHYPAPSYHDDTDDDNGWSPSWQDAAYTSYGPYGPDPGASPGMSGTPPSGTRPGFVPRDSSNDSPATVHSSNVGMYLP